MDEVLFGLDFGTSNSAVAVNINGDAVLLPLGSDGAASIPTLLYFPGRADGYYIGTDAIDKYISSGMKGRFLQSIKSLLPDAGFSGTTIAGWGRATAEDLAFCFLSKLKLKVDHAFPNTSSRVVIGRPAVFTEDGGDDSCAQRRLLKAAQRSGFKNIHFQYEPVAAALTYERSLCKPQLALIADLGGGTSDFTLMKLSPRNNARTDRTKDILATGGVYLAGDALNSAIMRAKVTPHFGEGATYPTYNGTRLDVPNDFFRTIARWEMLPLLKNPRDRERIERYAAFSDNPDGFHRLERLIEHNLGYTLFRSIESAKCHLSHHDESVIAFHEQGIDIEEKFTLSEFREISAPIISRILETAMATLARAGVQPEKVDSVFLTGGTSQVPQLQEAFSRVFGAEKLQHGDTFLSVAAGLALSAKSVFSRSGPMMSEEPLG